MTDLIFGDFDSENSSLEQSGSEPRPARADGLSSGNSPHNEAPSSDDKPEKNANDNQNNNKDQGSPPDDNAGENSSGQDQPEQNKPGPKQTGPSKNKASSKSVQKHQREVAAQFGMMIQKYAAVFTKLAKQPPLKKLMKNASKNVTKGRDLKQMAMDNMAVGFADAVKSMDDKDLPVELYKVILRARNGKKVSTSDAKQDLQDRVDHARTLKGGNPENVAFYKFLWSELNPKNTGPLINLRAQILNKVAEYAFPQDVVDIFNDFKSSAGMLANAYNSRAKDSKKKTSQNTDRHLVLSKRGRIDLDFGSASRGAGKKKDNNKGKDNNQSGDGPANDERKPPSAHTPGL